MNWDSFVPDLIVAMASAIVAIVVAATTYLITVRRRERNALRGLIEELHRRRALTRVSVARPVPGAKRQDDFHRVAASILSLRDEISRTRALVREKPALQEPLSRMRGSCNQYLEMSERDPDSYVLLLSKLRDELADDARKLAAARRGLVFKQPGSGAYEVADA